MTTKETTIFARLATLGLATLCASSAALILSPAEAQAWDFDACYSVEETETARTRPQAMIMLDRSGAMLREHDDASFPHPMATWPQQPGWASAIGDKWRNNARTGLTNDAQAAWADPSPFAAGAGYFSADYHNQPGHTEPSWGVGVTGPNAYQRGVWFNDSDSMWGVTQTQLRKVLREYESSGGQDPQVKFALGTFSTHAAPEVVNNSSAWARTWPQWNEDNYQNADKFMEFFDHPQQGGPWGGAPTAQAIKVMRAHSSITNQASSNAGILLVNSMPNAYVDNSGNEIMVLYSSDEGGEPIGYSKNGQKIFEVPDAVTHLERATEAALKEACEHRNVAPLHVVGFGDYISQFFNQVLAAAGGTGVCQDFEGNIKDPCGLSIEEIGQLQCSGAREATTKEELKAALDDAVSEVACTYPLDVSKTPENKAPADPEGTRVFTGQCTPGPATHTAWGSDFDRDPKKTVGASKTTTPKMGLSCTNSCGVVRSENDRLVYSLNTTPGEQNTVRIRVADYLHDCEDKVKIGVYADNNPGNPGANEFVGYWTGEGINDWNIAEFTFTPTKEETYISVVFLEDHHCGEGSGSCTGTCSPREDDLNLYVDWVKMVDPLAGCQEEGALDYVPDASAGDGWTFGRDRTSIRLVGQACKDARSLSRDRVVTQVACPCEYTTNARCKSPHGADCPLGKWQCSDKWQDICVPDESCEDGLCGRIDSHEIALNKPNVQLNVDNTGSMGWTIDTDKSIDWDDPTSRHMLARKALANLADWSAAGHDECTLPGEYDCERLRLGVHFWATTMRPKISARSGLTGEDIKNAFDNRKPTGNTHFKYAADLLQCEVNSAHEVCEGKEDQFNNALGNPDEVNVAIMVTDGQPNDPVIEDGDRKYRRQSVVENVRTTCAMRLDPDNAIPTYVVGFGVDNADAVNSLVAAAGGTGGCCFGEQCDPLDEDQQIDICDEATFDNYELGELIAQVQGNKKYNNQVVKCEGNIGAENDEVLQNKMETLFDELSCVFPLNSFPDNMQAAAKDPERTRVHLSLPAVGGVLKVPHENASDELKEAFVEELNAKGMPDAEAYRDSGWRYSAGRTAVGFGEKVCELLQKRQVDKVETQVCRDCLNVGKLCQMGSSDGYTFNLDSDDIAQEKTRCNLGVVVCEDGNERCDPFGPMPEVCNGRDDDCDGVVDNLSDSWGQSQFEDKDYSLGDEQPNASAACYERNVCVCANGPANYTEFFDPEELGYFSDDFDEYMEAWNNRDLNTCLCGEGITETTGAAPAATPGEPGADGGAMCSMSGSAESSALDAWWFVGVLGLLGAGRARRRYIN